MKKIILSFLCIALVTVLVGIPQGSAQNYKITNIETNGTVNENLDAIDGALTDFFEQAGQNREELNANPVEIVDDALTNMGDKFGTSVNRLGKYVRLLIGEKNYNRIVSFNNWLAESARNLVKEFGRILGEWFS